MVNILDMASKVPLPTISPTITGSATIGPPPVTSTLSNSMPLPTSTSFPGHPIPTKVFEHATKLGHISLWVVFAVMVIVSLIFMLMTIRIQKHLRLFHYLTILITLTASLTYFVLATGGGWSYHLVNVIHHHKKPAELIIRQVYWARYIQWAIGTGLSVIEMTVLAGLPGAEIILALFADVVMITFGLAAVTSHRKVKWGYLAIAALFYLYVIFSLILTSRRAAIARNARVGRLFTAFSIFVFVFWTMYPLVWILGSMTQRITVNSEIIWYGVLDIMTTAVFGGWLLLAHLRVVEGHVPLTGWWIDGSGNVDGTSSERRRLLDDD